MIRKYAEIFCWKNVSSFCIAKATHIFSAKNIRILYIESAKTVNEMTLNELVKLTTLWTTGPWLFRLIMVSYRKSKIVRQLFLVRRRRKKIKKQQIWRLMRPKRLLRHSQEQTVKLVSELLYILSRQTTQPTVRLVRPAKTQISLRICSLIRIFTHCMCLLQSPGYPEG